MLRGYGVILGEMCRRARIWSQSRGGLMRPPPGRVNRATIVSSLRPDFRDELSVSDPALNVSATAPMSPLGAQAMEPFGDHLMEPGQR